MKFSFKYRFILSFVTIEIFFLILIIVVNFSAISRTTEDLIHQKIESTSVLMGELVKIPMSVFDLATLDNAVQSVTRLKNVAVTRIYDASGNLLSDNTGIFSDSLLDRLKGSPDGIPLQIEGRTLQIKHVPLELEETRLGEILLVFDLSENIAIIKNNRQKTYIIIAVEIILSTLVSYLIGHRLTHALIKLSNAADGIARGRSSEVPDIVRSDEVGLLADSMRMMQNRIQERNQKLESTAKELAELNKTLEERIDEEVEKSREKDKMMLKHARQAAMGEMIGMIAHQWRQPITGIGMSTNNMLLDIEMGTLDEAKFTKNLELIDNQIKYLSHTIDDFRNFFKPNKEKELILVESLVEETLRIIGKSLENNNIEVLCEVDHGEPVLMYKSEMIQVMLNLLKNAQDAYKEKGERGKIHISSKEEERTTKIIIEDEAGGIPEEMMQKIFEPYFSTKSEKTGTGLGLYMNKTIVEEHMEGKLLVSNGENGARFEITLPGKAS